MIDGLSQGAGLVAGINFLNAKIHKFFILTGIYNSDMC